MAGVIHPKEALYVGMDIHKNNHAAFVGNCFGERYFSVQIQNSEEGWLDLLSQVKKTAETYALSPVWGLEDTGGSGQALAEFLAARGETVKTVNPVLVSRLRKKSPHPEKSDEKDAEGVAKVLIQQGTDTLPSFRVSRETQYATALAELVNDRGFLVKEKTRMKQHLHVLLYQCYGIGYSAKFKCIFSAKALSYFAEDALGRDCAGRPEAAVRWRQVARTVRRIQNVQEEIKEMEGELAVLLDESGTTIRTLSGCGTITSAVLLAEINDIRRFGSPAKLAKYAGLAPRQMSSGLKQRQCKSYMGNRRLNMAFYQVAFSQISRGGTALGKAYYKKKIGEGKTKMQALVSLKRRLLPIIFYMLRDHTAYDPNRHPVASEGE